MWFIVQRTECMGACTTIPTPIQILTRNRLRICSQERSQERSNRQKTERTICKVWIPFTVFWCVLSNRNRQSRRFYPWQSSKSTKLSRSKKQHICLWEKMCVRFSLVFLHFIAQVVVVGLVSCSQQGQRYDFSICDGTGSITARLYVGQNNADMEVMSWLVSCLNF